MLAAAEFDSARVASPCKGSANNGGGTANDGGNTDKRHVAGAGVRLRIVKVYEQGQDTVRRRPRSSGLGDNNVSTIAGREDRITGRRTVDGIARPHERVDDEAPPHRVASPQHGGAHDNATKEKGSDDMFSLERFVRDMEAKQKDAIDTVIERS